MFRLEVIDFIDQSNQALVARVPESGTAAIQYGAQLIVQQNQEAIFFRDGRAMDQFGPGRHTLTTANVPILTRILTSPWEKSPFQACVYFVGKQTFIDQRWGTRQPITIRDKDFGLVRLRGFGKFAYRVVDAPLLVNTLVGTQGRFTTEEIANYLRDQIVAGLTDLLASAGVSMLDLPAKFDEISAAARVKLADDFAQHGLELMQFIISSVTPPDEVQKAIDARSSMAAVGDLRSFTIYQAANSMANAAQNPGGSGAAGLGIGMGMVLPNILQQALQQAPITATPVTAVPVTSAPASAAGALAAGNSSPKLDFSSLQSTTNPTELVVSIAKQSGWQVVESNDGMELVVSLGSLRRQRVRVEFDKKDSEGHSLISFWTGCGALNPASASTLLRYNDQLIHGAFALRRDGGSEQLIIRANLLADTADSLEISRTVSAIAWQADQAEEQMSGANDVL